SWCTIAALIQYFFLRIRGSASNGPDSDRNITPPRPEKPNVARGRDHATASNSTLPAFASTGQWVIFFVGLTAMALFLRATVGTSGLSLEATVPLRVATVIFLAAACAFYFFGNFARAVADRIGSDALAPILTLTRIASLASFAAAGLIFLFLSTTR